jgi:hypothetical protein
MQNCVFVAGGVLEPVRGQWPLATRPDGEHVVAAFGEVERRVFQPAVAAHRLVTS